MDRTSATSSSSEYFKWENGTYLCKSTFVTEWCLDKWLLREPLLEKASGQNTHEKGKRWQSTCLFNVLGCWKVLPQCSQQKLFGGLCLPSEDSSSPLLPSPSWSNRTSATSSPSSPLSATPSRPSAATPSLTSTPDVVGGCSLLFFLETLSSVLSFSLSLFPSLLTSSRSALSALSSPLSDLSRSSSTPPSGFWGKVLFSCYLHNIANRSTNTLNRLTEFCSQSIPIKNKTVRLTHFKLFRL